LLVTAAYGELGGCGAYEIDISKGTHRPIRTDSKCRAFVMQVEPDGKRVLVADDSNFRVVDVLNGAVALSGIGRGMWSPDGSLLAIWSKGEAKVFDGRTFAKRGRFRAPAIDGHLVWSPDSKRVPFVQREHGCQDAFESLAALDIDTGREAIISSSHCMVISSRIGWVDTGALPGPSRSSK